MEDEGVVDTIIPEVPPVTYSNFAEVVSMLFSRDMNCDNLLLLLTQNVGVLFEVHNAQNGSYYHNLVTCAQEAIDFDEVDSVHELAKAIITLRMSIRLLNLPYYLVQLGSDEFVQCALGDDNYLDTFAVLECRRYDDDDNDYQ